MNKFIITIVALVSLCAHAEVVKPDSTVKPAKGKTTLGGVVYDYTVEDRGWKAHASSETMSGEKSFLIEYRSAGKIDGAVVSHDATEKCGELGQMEYQFQKIDPSWLSSVKPTILNSVVREDKAVFVCNVLIKASKVPSEPVQ